MASRLSRYLGDPLLARMYRAIREAGPLRAISVDLTHECNLRCTGCYFFAEGMDSHRAPSGDAAFDELVEREQVRGTNFVTIVGGEPSLELGRLKRLYDAFRTNVATNGVRRIPRDGFENLAIGVSVWGESGTDRELRGSGAANPFEKALANYRDDQRAFFYYTVPAGHAHEVEPVVERCIENGNRVLFNFFGWSGGAGTDLDCHRGFEDVRAAIDRVIERYPDRILLSSYLAGVVSSGELLGQRWGRETCVSISSEHESNLERIRNGNPYDPHFRAYNADFSTTRRCCTGTERDCSTCFDTWEHFSWVMLNMRKHMASKQAFTEWLTTSYLFYFINRIVDVDEGGELLPEIHRRTRPTPTAIAGGAHLGSQP